MIGVLACWHAPYERMDPSAVVWIDYIQTMTFLPLMFGVTTFTGPLWPL
jgi:hypothetical protein